jgi:glucose/arabinose dehydrogenase
MKNSSVIAIWLLLMSGSAGGVEKGRELIDNREGHSVQPQVIQPTEQRLKRLELPEGFWIGVFASGLGAPRMMAVGEDGTVYVTRRETGDVLALRDEDGDGRAESIRTVVRSLPGVHGITVHEGKMYLCTVDAAYVAEITGDGIGKPRKILDGLPPGGRHPNRTMAFGPDGLLYITVGSTCNCCLEEHEESASIIRVRPDGTGRELFATGLRNTLGIGWHPETGEMYGMDHGTDWLGDDFPPEELNRLGGGNHYGWPFVYGKGKLIQLQNYPEGFDAEDHVARSTPSVLEYQAHSAPLQMVFYTAGRFPGGYRNDAFVAMHGSWNRKPPGGYEVVRVRFEDGKPASFEPFLTGFLMRENGEPKTFGRPAGLAVTRDGALLVGCDKTGFIYRISYEGS